MPKNMSVGALHLIFSPINSAWLLLWGSQDITQCQTLRVFTNYQEGSMEFNRVAGC